LSAPFCSRGFRWNFLPALPRLFEARSSPVPTSSRDGASPVSPSRKRNSTSPNPGKEHGGKDHGVKERGLETHFRKKRTRKKEASRFHQRQEKA
jgi:hypothetical protein